MVCWARVMVGEFMRLSCRANLKVMVMFEKRVQGFVNQSRLMVGVGIWLMTKHEVHWYLGLW